MSDTSQGPGWWQASDGRWYPPQSHPGQPTAPPAPSYGAPTSNYGAPVGYGAPAPVKTGMAGWVKALLIIGGILALLVGGCTVALGVFANKVSGDLTKGCSFLTKEKASAALGSGTQTLPLNGLTSIANVALDTRVLKGAPSCMLIPQGSGATMGTGRVAKLTASDAQAVFAKELASAKGTSVDKGNGLTVSTEPYLGEELGIGDEGFCTTSGLPISYGALIRKGDTLVYVSFAPSTTQAANAANGGLTEAESLTCQLDQKVAKILLNI